MIERRFAAARHAGDAGEKPERDRGRDIFEIVAMAPTISSLRPGSGCAPLAASRDLARAR